MNKYLVSVIIILSLFSFAIAQEIPSATSDQKVRVQVVVSDAAVLGKGAPVIIDYANTAANKVLTVEGVSATSSVLMVGVLESTLEVGATGTMIVSGVTDVLMDSGGATAGATFGTGNTTKGEATSGHTGGGIVLASRSGRGLTKCLIKGVQ